MPNFYQIYTQLLTEGLVDDLRKKYVDSGKIGASVFHEIESADPTPKKKYVLWLIRNVLYNNLKTEDIYKAEEYIPIVEKLRDKKIIDPKFSDPNAVKTVMKTDPYDGKQKPVKVPKFSFDEFKNYAVQFKLSDDQLASKSDIKEKTKVYETENWAVYSPETYEQSCVLGSGTEWCTATGKTDKYFNMYKHGQVDLSDPAFLAYNVDQIEQEAGDLFIIVNKNNTGEKYQLQPSSREFMDKNDNAEDYLKFFFIKNKELLPFLDKVYSSRVLYEIKNMLKNIASILLNNGRESIKSDVVKLILSVLKKNSSFIKSFLQKNYLSIDSASEPLAYLEFNKNSIKILVFDFESNLMMDLNGKQAPLSDFIDPKNENILNRLNIDYKIEKINDKLGKYVKIKGGGGIYIYYNRIHQFMISNSGIFHDQYDATIYSDMNSKGDDTYKGKDFLSEKLEKELIRFFKKFMNGAFFEQYIADFPDEFVQKALNSN